MENHAHEVDSSVFDGLGCEEVVYCHHVSEVEQIQETFMNDFTL